MLLSRIAAPFAVALLCATPLAAQTKGGTQQQQPQGEAPTPTAGGINFGDDSSEWSNDGECDDRRFAGPGVAAFLAWENTGRDASDCSALVSSGAVRLWDLAAARAATQCSAINFGNDSGAYVNDNECDDLRFEGMGMASVVGPDEVGKDASDCRRACDFGLVGLRDY